MQNDKPAVKDSQNTEKSRDENKGDFVLFLADGSTVRAENLVSTHHNGMAVVRSWYDPQDN